MKTSKKADIYSRQQSQQSMWQKKQLCKACTLGKDIYTFTHILKTPKLPIDVAEEACTLGKDIKFMKIHQKIPKTQRKIQDPKQAWHTPGKMLKI